MDLTMDVYRDVDLKEETDNCCNNLKFGVVGNLAERNRLVPNWAFHTIYVGGKNEHSIMGSIATNPGCPDA
jgi:hypothetical protein